MLNPRLGILDIVPYVTGDSMAEGHEDPIKLSSNEAALGPSPLAIDAYNRISGILSRYPDGAASDLCAAIAARYGLNSDRIICSNGSEQLIDLLARAYAGPGDEIVYSQYGFISYRIATLAAGATPVVAPEVNFTSSVEALLGAITDSTKIVFLANPNNPTGTYLAKKQIMELRQGLPENVLLVLDEAYADYVDCAEYGTGFDMVSSGASNVVILRTFSKIYGLAGLRVGWGYMPEAVAEVVNRIRGAFNVNAAGQAAAIAAIEDVNHTTKAKAHNSESINELSQRIHRLGIDVTPSVGNFLLLHFADANVAKIVDAHLKKCGIILRPVSGYGLPQCLRLTIGLHKENAAVMNALWSSPLGVGF